MRKELLTIPIVAIIIVVGIVGAVLYFTRQEAISVIRPPGWKAYTNEGYGIGFAYPGDWQAGEYPGGNCLVRRSRNGGKCQYGGRVLVK